MAEHMSQFILYGTVGCHLCELAEAQLMPLLEVLAAQGHAVEIECIDISDSDELSMRYGETIPVLQRVADDAAIAWPFDTVALREFLQR